MLNPRKTTIDYLYDFGDCWERRLIVTDIRQGEPGVLLPRYIGGEWAGPPEDAGGVPGFYEKLDAMADPDHPEHDDIVEWLGDYDPKEIDELPLKSPSAVSPTAAMRPERAWPKRKPDRPADPDRQPPPLGNRRGDDQPPCSFGQSIIHSLLGERLRRAMQAHENPLFTTTEAAVLTGLSVKAVNNAIDKGVISAAADTRAGTGARLLDRHALISLTLERRLADRFAPELRRAVFDALAGASRCMVSLDGGFLRIDLREPRRELANSLRRLRRARELVVSDPDIMGGEPVFRGTRVPAHMIAAQLGQGSTEWKLLEAYPRLTPEMIDLAPVYAAAYPLRGRPRAQPWRDRPPVRQTRRKLATIGAA